MRTSCKPVKLTSWQSVQMNGSPFLVRLKSGHASSEYSLTKH